jgi:predicted nuclease with TOPRIM domain
MDLQTYCDSMSSELTAWKAKVYDVVRKLDKTPSGDKTKVVPHVNELHMIIEELGGRITKLRTECPTVWEPQKEELEGKITHLKKRWEEVWHNVSPSDFGG